MKQGYSHITLVCDRSGSMGVIQKAAQSGVNEFINDQCKAPGTATLHLYDFCAPVFGTGGLEATGFTTVFQGDVRDAGKYFLHTGGMTALLDALGKTIDDTGKFLSDLAEDERPEHVFFVIQTDGEENSSTKFKFGDIQAMIKHQTEVYGWTFVYLGMGVDTFAQGRDLGFSNAVQAAEGTEAAYASTYSFTSSNVAATRGGKSVNWNVDVDKAGNTSERK